MKRTLLPVLLSAALPCGLATAQQSLPFPLEVTSVDQAGELVRLTPDLERIGDLMAPGHVVLTDIFLPDGRLVDAELFRIDLAKRKFGFHVDGQPRPDLLDGLDLSIWKGTLTGDPSSEVMLSFSRHGCRGWIESSGGLVHLMPGPDDTGDWMNGFAVLVTEDSLLALGNSMQEFCEAESLRPPTFDQVTAKPAGAPSTGAPSCTLRECPIALETDWQLYQVFGNLSAMTTYVTTLLSYGSDRYETQISTVLTFPYMQFYTNSNDPWSAQDSGGNCVDVLYEFQAAWVGNVPAGANIGHLLSGASLGCGVAWVDVLCNNEYNFSVSGNINGMVNFPVVQQPNNWDFIVFTHELGHNFGALHTHDYCPPLDECAPSGYFGQCQNQQVCISNGTIMSYCHLCSGGTANITTWFHTHTSGIMTTQAAGCLPLYSGYSCDPPTVLSTTATTPIEIEIVGSVTGNVDLYYRYQGGAYASSVMTNTGGNIWAGDLPIAACGDAPEFYIEFTEAACGTVTAPDGAPGNVYTAVVGDLTEVFVDNFETNQGWTAVNLGASSGDWQRGVPVDDGSWQYDPASDYDGSGSCYLTQNESGNTDVDGGAVELTSPTFDLSGGPALIEYAYYLYLTNEDGTDKLLVQLSENGTSGPWKTVATHTTTGGLSWRTHSISADDLVAAGVTQTASMAIRFTANDGDSQSIVEAGVDAMNISVLGCGDTGPTQYCLPANANSVSSSGTVMTHISGDAGGVITVQLDGAVQNFGLLFYGPNQQDLPFASGRRCVANPLTRSTVYLPDASTYQVTVDTAGYVGDPLNIQAWYRDPDFETTCGDDFNTSSALSY